MCICAYCCSHFSSPDSCTYHLENEDLIVSELFQLLDSVRDRIGIMDWGIKMTTMEDGGCVVGVPLFTSYNSVLAV